MSGYQYESIGIGEKALLEIFIKIMKVLCLFLAVLIVSILNLDAFLPSPRIEDGKHRRADRLDSETSPFPFGGLRLKMESRASDSLEHEHILWKLRPPPEVSRWRRLWLRFAANTIRLDCTLKRQEPPLVLCPKGRQAVLEAHYRPMNSSKYEKVARFGFTTERGPSNEAVRETVYEIYGIDKRYVPHYF
jgi:hypothetical protein